LRKIAIYILLISAGFVTSAQSSLSFYNLGDATFQSSNFNPAYIPSDKVMIGLPELSGVHLGYNNKLSYNDVITKTTEGTQEIDFKKALSGLQRQNMVSAQTSISLFHVAFATRTKGAISFFANERMEADLLYSEPFMRMITNGNASTLDEEISLSDTRAMATYYREIGVGYAFRNDALGIKIGGRLKYLQGFANVSTPENMRATVKTGDETYNIDASLENTILRSSGLNIMDGSTGNLGDHLISNGNRGVAIDLGMTYKMNDYTTISASLVDVGFISWKEDIENRGISDTSFSYNGINLVGIWDLEETIKDSLIDKFELDKSFDAYSTILSPKAYFSYTRGLRNGGDLITSVGVRYIQAQVKTMVGVGYRHKIGEWFTGSVNVTRLPQQFLNLGAAFTVTGGPVQFYLAADQVAYWDMTEFKSFDLRLGVNLVFKGKSRHSNENNQGSNPYFNKITKKKGGGMPEGQSFLGRSIEIRGIDGIYNIIRKQRRRALYKINKDPRGEKRQIERKELPEPPRGD
jgi:hypothetical protein